ncbi:MAG: tyrosine--tRNA ligase [Acidibacillus sp.]|nr:tyrosine--tRNA ligase [Acidibacillus sp.]
MENQITDSEQEVERQLAIIRRGAVEIIPEEELAAKIRKSIQTGQPLRIKLGLDPSAPDIHVGHVVVLEKLRQLQDLGHIVQLVIGDFTGRIGDPTGKSETRKQLTEQQVKDNASSYERQVFKVLDESRTEIHFNSTWLAPLSFADVILLAQTLTVARMLERDDFKKRFTQGAPISIHEFFYPLMQGYDSVALQTDIELGGTDQTFNLLMGRTLQKEYGLEPQIALTMPIIEGLDGVQKMSKSLSNYIGVDESAKEIYGKSMSIPDELMIKYYDLLSGLSKEEVQEIQAALTGNQLHPRDAKMRLAFLLTARFQGVEAAEIAQEEFVRVFQKHTLPDDIQEFPVAGAPVSLVALLVSAKLAPSNSEARRLIIGGGVRLDSQQVSDPTFMVEPRTGMIVQVGKRKFIKLLIS